MESYSHPPRKWSLSEDQKLREGVEAQQGEVKDWCIIAESLPGRTNKDCRKRWHNSVAGGLKKGQWSKSEDELLSRGIEEYGQKWTMVASCVGTRSADQCAKRWQQSLDPSLDRSTWRDDDDTTLIEAVQRLGRHWKDIQREHFPERSKNDIKNRYTVIVRRYKNQGITLSHAPSSPSDSGTPAPRSSFADDDTGYLSPSSGIFDSLLQTPSSQRGHRLSWSSFDNDAYSTWSSQQAYAMPDATSPTQHQHQHQHQHHHHQHSPSGAALPQYAYTQPPPLPADAHPPWNHQHQTSSHPYMQHAAPAASLHMEVPTSPSLYDYTGYPGLADHTQHPIMGPAAPYTAPASQAPNATMPRRLSPSAPDQHQRYGRDHIYRDASTGHHAYYPS
ncbi:uncharacterized protein SETTUDRAFT_110184 [Exserohilum turcica Et28A]|uniref:Uncharacterized protein n=1 Tax=Exserohilum turcicum (strain 28A) TaxID=671987 RepID=R0KDG8_EXST2|nr:uncharacterized protein SETTUDRAFT_110184 [Exserohilum turcica Et28A]EOA86197.1 hypothetical protein SETTUDRAFT_110184 [Exserohilum turcica Et28A]